MFVCNKRRRQYHHSNNCRILFLSRRASPIRLKCCINLRECLLMFTFFRHQISLFACVSHLKWDFEAGADIKGRMCIIIGIKLLSIFCNKLFVKIHNCFRPSSDVFFQNPDEIRAFHFAAGKLGEVEQADALWTLMARDIEEEQLQPEHNSHPVTSTTSSSVPRH